MLTDLAVSPISETLRRLSAERRSGDLEVRSGRFVKTVFFDHGRIVFAASNLRKDRLGEALVEMKLITKDEFARATALMRGARRRRFGEALVQAGVMNRDEIGRAVARQVRHVILSIFQLEEGAAQFDERTCVIPLEFMVSLSMHRLLYAGIKLMSRDELVLAGIGPLDRYVTLAAVPPFKFGLRKCSAEELEVLELAKRRVTLRRLAWAPGGLAPSRLKSAYALAASGILEDADQPERPEARPIIQMETGTFLLSTLRNQPELDAREAIRREVDEELERSARMDRETWLRVSRSAPAAELAKAIEEKMERYHALLEAVGDDEALRTDIELVLGRASSMLRMTRRTASDVAGSPGSPAVDSKQPPAAPASAPAAGRASQPAPASETPSARAPGQPPPQLDPSVMGSAGQLGLDHLLMEGQLRMTVGDYAAAVQSYSRLVDLAPSEAGPRVRLAIAMACWPKTAKQAEREFLEAVRLAPENADIHYHFGLYYKAMRVRSRAIAEFRTALSLNPRHQQARGELEALSPKDSALTSLRKLFK